MKRFAAVVCAGLCSVAVAQEQAWTTPFTVDGRHQPVIVSPQFDIATSPSSNPIIAVTPYAIDYQSLSTQLDYYEWVYFVGQIVHGSLMLMVKPKFMAY